jgi:hypothetical protein
MLYLNPNKEKVLTFEVEVSGANADEITGFVRFFLLDNVQLGFPAIVKEGQIQAVIAPLKELVKKPIKNGTILEAQLDLYTEENDYFSPWSGEIEVKMPVRVEAKMVEESDIGGTRGKSNMTVKAKVITEKNEGGRAKPKQQTLLERKEMIREQLKNVTEKDIIRYMEKAGTKTKRIQKIILEQAEAGAKSNLDVLKNVVKILKKNK